MKDAGMNNWMKPKAIQNNTERSHIIRKQSVVFLTNRR